jgi:uncharacterized protein YbjT (DUF2867 family)
VIGAIVVTGATGRQGGAVVRALLEEGRLVGAVTRDPRGRNARALAALGAEVVGADMDDPSSLDRAFAGAHGVYSVQNPMISGTAGEVRQGRNVGEAARRAGVRHLVYASAGPGVRGTGVGSWESKLDVEEHLERLGLSTTVLRPMAFMELMTDPAFYPAAGVWHVWPQLAGGAYRAPWICSDDLGVIAAKVFAGGDRYVGRRLTLAAELLSLDECRATYAQVFGRKPKRLPMPVWLFQRFAADTADLWRWTRTGHVDVDADVARSIHPDALTVEAWLRRQVQRAVADRTR